VLLALHGFDRSADAFEKAAPLLAEHYTLYALDLPFHGQTEWLASTYGRRQLLEMAAAVLQHSRATSLSVLGHSLGARLALSLALGADMAIEQVFLLAPDGLGGAPSRWVDWMPHGLRRAVAYAALSWDRLPVWADRLRRRNCVSAAAYRLLLKYWQYEHRRVLLLATWLSLPLFPVQARQLHGLQPRVQLILGRHDQVIDNQGVLRFFSGYAAVRINWADAGHDLPARPERWAHYCWP
jgi:pimeloyl-ACP methyl ester carboxylesterase